MRFSAYIGKVIDGDSFRAVSEDMRLEGVYAPEINSERGRKAKAKLEGLILGKNIEYEEQARDVYRRLIVQVWLSGMNVNLAMKRYVESL